MVQEAQIRAAIAAYEDPYLKTDLISAGCLTAVESQAGVVRIVIELGFPAAGYCEDLAREIGKRVEAVDGIDSCTTEVGWNIITHAVQRNLKPIGQIRNILAVASGKGGVGKSTTAANLALALAAEGAAVGLLDADIYGPSQPRMLGAQGVQPESADGKSMIPVTAHGIATMSIGYLIDEEQPMIWRGPMVTQALNQLIGQTDWGALDYLLVDLPPGTGDTQLTLSQNVPVSGAIIITTPQDIALLDARKGLKMFEKVEVPVLGIVENMSTHICSQCGHEEPVFGSGGGARMAEQDNVPLLGTLPLDMRIREEADGGCPTVVADPDSEIARRYREIARRTAARLSHAARDYRRLFPNITVEEDQ